MKNFAEIAEKCLNGELSGMFTCAIGKTNGKIVNVPSKRLQKEVSSWPYIFILNYSDKEVSYDKYDRFGISEYGHCEVINFIPDMKENDKRTIQVSLQQAREWYNSGNDTLKTLALSSFSKKELDPYSRSWEEYCKSHIIGGRWFKSSLNGNIIQVDTDQRESNYPLNMYQDVDTFINKELAEKFIAYMQLISLRQEWIHIWSQEQGLEKDWEPKYNRFEPSIYRDCTDNISVGCFVNIPLSFPTKELATDFMNTFKSLLEQARGLY